MYTFLQNIYYSTKSAFSDFNLLFIKYVSIRFVNFILLEDSNRCLEMHESIVIVDQNSLIKSETVLNAVLPILLIKLLRFLKILIN